MHHTPAPAPAQLPLSSAPLGRAEAERRQGLSQAHISTPAWFTYAVGGRLARVSNPDCLHSTRPAELVIVPGAVREYPTDDMGPGSVVWESKKRGAVAGFSRQSRIRMMQRIAEVNHRDMLTLPVMVTLTYPGEYDSDPAVYKAHLDALHTRLTRRYGKVALVWKLEFQKRGAPHFHFLIYFDSSVNIFGDGHHTPSCECFRCWLAASWYAVVGSGDMRHYYFLRSGRTVELLRSVRGIQSYVSKYVAKVVEGVEQHVGRWWGVWAWSLVPVALVRVMLTPAEFYRLRRVFAGVRRSHKVDVDLTARRNGLWLFLPEEEALRALHWLLGTKEPGTT